ncbi:MAG: hypothetical protein KAH32_07675 [Chlamydiia bacterium]|nr:hypothetical protein [Chlamydiia bacterium]
MTTVDIFIDGLDIGAVNDVDGLFGQSLIDLTDYIKISKGREVILNTYTAYEDYANLGDYTMRESACARWDGTTANPTYSYESVATELERADFHKQHGVPVLAQVFGNITDYEKSYYCFMQTKVLYGDLATVSYNQPNFDYTDASDDFQWNYYKYPDIGSELEGDYTTVGTDSYSRRFEHGTITVNTSTHTVEYISDEEINNIELCGYYYDNDDGASDEGYMHFKINDKMSHSFNVVDTDLTAFVKTYKCVNISTDYYEPSGFYEMEFYYIDSDANYLTNGGLYMYHSTVAGNDRLSFYDQNLNDHPVNNEKDYTYYATGDNWALNFTIDKSGTENNLDEVTSVINRTTSGTEIINVTFDSTGSWSLNVYDRTQFINTSIFNNITVSGIVLNWTESDCNTNNPTYGESVINSETWKACKYNHSTKGFYTKVVVPSLSTKSYLINGEIISPTCTLVSVSIADLEVNSTGTYEIIINCSSPQVQINGTSFLIGRTVQTEFPNPNGNHWSLRPPNNDKSTLDSHYDNQSILLADQRVLGSMWYESLFSDNYTWAVTTNTTPSGQNPYVTLDCYAKSCIMNYSSPVEVAIFPSTLYLSRGKMESETKKEYLINSNDGLLIKFWDSKKAHGEDNYTTTLFLNLNYTGKPNKDLNFFYCNSSYNTSGTLAPQDDIDNCVYLSSFDKTYLDSRVYSSRNSSYVKGLFSVINGKIAGIETTKIAYGYLRSQVPNTLSYTVRYTNGTSGTNVSFKDSKTAWTSTNDGDTFTQAEFTPDIWFSQIDNNSQSHIKVYVTDIYGNSYNNLAFRNDTIGDVNFAIGSPSIQAYKTGISLPSNHTNEDEDLNGTYTGFMTIHVNIAIDPDANGIVNHSLYLTNTNGSINYTINSTFYSSDDSDIHIYFNTSLVSSGTYKMNVTAVSDEDLTHETSFLSYNNFTINHVTNTAPYSILNSPTDNYTFPVGTSSVVLNFTALDKDNDTMNITIFKGDGTLLSTQNNIANGTDVTYTWTGLTSGSIYNWYYNITDGLLTNQTRNYSFKILKIDISPSSVSKSISANESFNVIYRVSHNSDTSLPFNISFINTINTTYFNTSFNETSFNVKADQERLIKLTVDSIASTPEQTFTGKTRISQSNQDYDTDITINIQEDYGEPTLYYGNTLCTLSSSNNCYQNGVKTTSESIEKSFKIKNTGDYELLSCVPSLKGDLNESSVTFVPYSFTLAVNEEKTLSYLISPLSEGSYYGYMDVLCDSNGKDVSLDSNNLAILNIAVVNTTSTSGTSGTSGNTPEETTTTNATTDFTFTLSNNILQVNQNDTINYRLYIDNIGTTVLNINLRCYGNLCEETTYNNYTSELAVGESLQIDAETFISEDAKDTELLTFKVYGKSQVLKLQISANVFEKIQHKLSIDLEFGDFKINGMALTIISLIALFTMFYIGILLIPAFNNWEGIAKVLLSFLSSIIITFIVILII